MLREIGTKPEGCGLELILVDGTALDDDKDGIVVRYVTGGATEDVVPGERTVVRYVIGGAILELVLVNV